MRRARITITLNNEYLGDIDTLVDNKKIRNRSHAIEYILGQYFKNPVKKAVILAGGKGTKLRPYTYEVPKALLPIKDRPILEYLIENLKKSGIYDLIICTGYLGEKIQKYFGNGSRYGVHITYSHETTSLNTGGAIMKIKNMIKTEPFLVVNGDIVSDFLFKDLIKFHEKEKTIVSVALVGVEKPENFGQLTIHGTQLVNFYRSEKQKPIKSHLINSGIYVLDSNIFAYFPKDKEAFSLEEIIEKLIKQKKVSGFIFEGKWFDVGDTKNYELAIRNFI